MNYQGHADRNFARACWARTHYSSQVHTADFPPVTYPLSQEPAEWARSCGLVHTPHWLRRSLCRVARRWLRERGDQGRALATRHIEVRVTADGSVSVHLHAYSRRAQRRAANLAPALALRLARSLRASADGPERGWWTVVVSWGYDPEALGTEDRQRHVLARKAVA